MDTPTAARVPKAAIAESANAKVRVHVRLPIDLDGRVVVADLWTFSGLSDGVEHLAVGLGDWRNADPPLVRPHSECLTGDVLGSTRCDCGNQLQESLRSLHEQGGILIYLRQEGRGIGLYNKLDAYSIQDFGLDTFAANRFLGFDDDGRRYEVVAEILRALGIARVDLLTNNPAKVEEIIAAGIEVASVLLTEHLVTPDNASYTRAKIAQAGHWAPESTASRARMKKSCENLAEPDCAPHFLPAHPVA